MLTVIRDKNIMDMLDGKRHRNADIFKIVEEELKKRGFLKTLTQIRTKWKALKLRYYKIKRANLVSGSDRRECPFWEQLDEILGHRPGCNVEGVESSRVVVSDETENYLRYPEEDVEAFPDVVVIQSESEPTASSSKEQESNMEQGPVRKKKKVEKKGYAEAMKTFSKDIRESQKEIANMFLEKQAEMIANELEQQRQWEEKLLEKDRLATERMLTNLMSLFFQNVRQAYQPPDQFRFFNPSQALIPNSVPVPFISPVTPTTINVPQPQEPSNPNDVPFQNSSPASPTINFPRPQTPSNPNYASFPYSLPVTPTINFPRPHAPSNPNYAPFPYPSPESPTIPFPTLASTSETQFSTQADGSSKPQEN